MDRKLHQVELHNPYIIRMTKQGRIDWDLQDTWRKRISVHAIPIGKFRT